MHLLRSLSRSKEGATAIEYGLIAALIAVALIVGLGGFSDALLNVFNTIEGYLESAVS
ncbi:Flp family type IVb pilin [Rhizobium halophilum]|jgi:pilus assembly protein Flp/PilA|uniref:Flp family type IVb pilin n=1 Tax=Rhizobium halophilum TaxID=2846852 RepID=UPI001EFD8888|nr:Flp family type IVb pilin [Rhizobium halophilum]MCF6368745.1 Flp family type IVb pilin [Rhizobium halophilum]HEV7437045.1 Flp family type IVb pilin [Pseudorhizobium sp.]